MHVTGEQIHAALWPTVTAIHLVASRHYAFEGRCFVQNERHYADMRGTSRTEIPEVPRIIAKGAHTDAETRRRIHPTGR